MAVNVHGGVLSPCAVVILSLVVFSLSLVAPVEAWRSPLTVGYYRGSCPNAERIVRKTVKEAVVQDPTITAGLLRMHFHDCFVRGCDGSVLLKSSKGDTERDHPANNPSLRGFDVINRAKSRLEAACPRTVSCADIIAFAARDSAYLSGGIKYAVPSGRRDGRISRAADIMGNLPAPVFDAPQLIDNFQQKGLSADEMVTLSGAHSIGVAHCTSFSDRLYSFNGTGTVDPTMEEEYANFLKTKCPRPRGNGPTGSDPVVPLDISSPTNLDNKYYQELRSNRGLLKSDQTLQSSPKTAGMVVANARDNGAWAEKFVKAMVKMGSIEVITGSGGEVRRTCSAVN
ncbi:hypothetical protein MLD38_012379 [Melastoma candidum]|uniref:Uncharacterized protein n=1 Tax=Melastoma candidum TaxID=119954 RepID=A0ACB9R6Q4_9MYRT|nr:hypothetical protein MLD38_012379 [Melastoma candidum]